MTTTVGVRSYGIGDTGEAPEEQSQFPGHGRANDGKGTCEKSEWAVEDLNF